MNDNQIFLSESEIKPQNNKLENIVDLADRLDFLDIQVLRKFYLTGKGYPYDSQPYCFPVLFLEMKVSRQLKIGAEAFRKRLDVLVDLGFLEKIKHSNPVNYGPIKGKEEVVRAVIKKFFIINGLTQFL